jgi:hypothetical protein
LLLGVIESGTSFAADAAAEALADSGALAEARHRVDTGEASDVDRALISYVSAQEAVSA